MIISYFGFLIAIEEFIYKKIKLIYRTIHNLKLKKDDALAEFSLGKDIISQVSGNKRDKVYCATEILSILEDVHICCT